MKNSELDNLIEDYADATNSRDRLIRRKLQNIAALCAECAGREFVFAKEISAEFCRVIRLLEEENTPPEAPVVVPQPKGQYASGEDLLAAFYNYFKADHQIDYSKIEKYPFADAEERRWKVSATLKDYVARIKTFSVRYLPEVQNRDGVPGYTLRDGKDRWDVILFVYDYIEEIWKNFNVVEDGMPNKQRQNIRSALRKLRDFKRDQNVEEPQNGQTMQ